MFARTIHNHAPLYVIASARATTTAAAERITFLSSRFIRGERERNASRSRSFSGITDDDAPVPCNFPVASFIADASGHFVYEQFARTPPDPPPPLYHYLCLCDPTPPKSREHSFNSHHSRAVPPRWSADVNTSRLPPQDQVICNLSIHQRVWVSYLPWSR